MSLEKMGFTMETDRFDKCETHGEYVSKNLFRSVWSGCPQCAAERQAIEQREAEERKAAERHREWQRRLGESGIPERFHARTLESYRIENEGQRKAIAFANHYAEQIGGNSRSARGAVFSGAPGTGKTHIAVGIGMRLMAKGKLVLFTTVQRMVRRMKDTWRKDSTESESDVVRLLVEPDLLILDEIGVQFGTEFERNLMFDVLNERYEKSKPTLLLTNLTIAEVRAFLGDRVFDRLREDGGEAVAFDWGSYRARLDLLSELEEPTACASAYGLCG